MQYPRRQSEFEIQAYLFSELKAMGLDVRGEVRAGRESRFDLVVFEERVPKIIVEVKTRKLPKNPTTFRAKERTRRREEQLSRYDKYGLPVHLIEGMRQAGEFIQRMKQGEG